jgi:hypothetical protein
MSDYENAVGQLGGIKEYVELLAAPAEVQFKWLVENGYATAELWNQLSDAVPAWLPFLREHVEVSADLEDALLDLLEFLNSTDHGNVFGGMSSSPCGSPSGTRFVNVRLLSCRCSNRQSA